MKQHNLLVSIIKALLVASPTPICLNKISEITGQAKDMIESSIALLENELVDDDILILKKSASGFRIVLNQEMIPWVQKLYDQKPQRLSKALLETLALIAYRQPITRTEIEVIRGVAVNSNIIRHLMEEEWIKVVGHRDLPGKPELLATTKKFLDDFGLLSLKELPSLEDSDQETLEDHNIEPMIEKNVSENEEIDEN